MTIKNWWQKLVIIKVDDLGFQPGTDNFRRLIEIAYRRRIPLSIGVVTSCLPSLSRQNISYFSACFQDSLFELWNHSHTHRDLTTLSFQHQLDDIKTAQQLIYETFGIHSRVFGAPYNKYNENTLLALNSCIDSELDLQSVYLVTPDIEKSCKLLNAPRISLVSPEFVRPTTRQCDLLEFIRRYRLLNDKELLVVQIHPNAWNEYGFEQFEQCLDYLLSEGARFLTMRDYNALCNFRSSNQQGDEVTPNIPVKVRAIVIDELLKDSAQSLKETFSGDRRLSDFFYNRHKLGTQYVIRSLEKIEFDLPKNSAPDKNDYCIDIGCGSGNWLIGYGILHPNAKLYGIDELEPCVEISRKQLAAAGMIDRANISCSSAEAPPPLLNRFDRAWCINAGQYMNKESLFSFAHKALKHNGIFLLSIQTIDYFLSSAFQAITSPEKDCDRTFTHLNPIVISTARRLGVKPKPFKVQVHSHDEIIYCAKQLNFQINIEDVSVFEGNPKFRGRPLMKSYLMTNYVQTQDSAKGNLSFLNMPSPEKVKYLDELRKYGMWSKISELFEYCKNVEPAECKYDVFTILTQNQPNFTTNETHNNLKHLSPSIHAVIEINNGNLNSSFFSTNETMDSDTTFLISYTHLLLGNLQQVLNKCEKGLADHKFDSQLAILYAAAACKLGKPNLALEKMELLYSHSSI